MLHRIILRSSFLCIFLFIELFSFGQKSNIVDGRNISTYCGSCQTLIEEMPKEVLFGIFIQENGDVYFAMSDKMWFNKIFKNKSYGVSVDIISKDRYNCKSEINETHGIPKGILLPTVYKNELENGAVERVEGKVYTKIGNIPKSLIGKELEGNLVILNGPYICYYTNFVNIDRNEWQLLPMGFFTDTIFSESKSLNANKEDFFTYSKKTQIEIPFLKGSFLFSPDYLNRFFDSLNLSTSRIKKIEIRAYSSVEGSEIKNGELSNKRAESIVNALKKYQSSLNRVTILAAENWLDFFKDIKGTKFSDLENQSKISIKQKLSNQNLALEIEPILASHRKVIATLYLEDKSQFFSESDSSILIEFKNAIDSKKIDKAKLIQKEIADRITDKRLPIYFIDKIEVPKSKEYSSVLNDREVYKLLLKATDEYQAFENFMELKKIDPQNGRLNYNICVLRFFMWQYGDDTLSRAVLLKEMNELSNQGIPISLIKRMQINYYLLKGEDQMRTFNYAGKDSSLKEIRNIFGKVIVSDEDIYSLSKYYSFYSHQEWAKEIIEPRIGNLNVSEDLIFFYLNLLFFQPKMYDTEVFRKAILNATNLNPKRFCRFFKPNGKGGASMQLLEYEEIKSIFCSECK